MLRSLDTPPDGSDARAARRQEQPAAALSRARSARFPTAPPATCSAARESEDVQRQDRLRRHDRARHARSRGDADRHAVCRRRGAGDSRRQPAAARFPVAARHRRRGRDADRRRARHRLAALLVGRFGLAWGCFGRRQRLAAVWVASLSAAVEHGGIFVSPLFPTMGLIAALAAMAAAGLCSSGAAPTRRAGQRDLAAPDGAGAAVADRAFSDRRDRPALAAHTEVHARARAQLAKHPTFHDYLTPERIDLLASLAPLHDIGKVGVPDARSEQARRADADELRGDAEASRRMAATSSTTPSRTSACATT